MFKKEVLFVVDISGSMRGKPLEDTKSAIFAALSELIPGDSFNVIAFNDEAYLFSSSLELATKEAIEKATEWIGMNFVAGGGTNLSLPLNKVQLHFHLLYVQMLGIFIFFLFCISDFILVLIAFFPLLSTISTT